MTPEWLRALTGSDNNDKPPADPPPTSVGDGETTPAARRALDGITRRLTDAVEGTRNGLLNWAAYRAGQYHAAGCLSAEDARTAIYQAAYACGLTEPEVTSTWNQGWPAGQNNPQAPLDRHHTPDLAPFALATNTDRPATDGDTPEHTSWWPRTLGTHTDEEPGPTHLTRQDGQHLLYGGRINALLGESESGKTWIALLAAKQHLEQGGTVLYLDFEDTAQGITNLLTSLGVTHHDNLTYISPDESLHAAARNDLETTILTHQPGLIIMDGVNAAMTVMGLDLMSNRDATNFSQLLLRPLARTGAAVITIDHVAKNPDTRGKGGIGAQAKRADVTGCALTVAVKKPFGRGMTGRLKLTVDKDRQGHVRAASGGAKAAGEAVLASSDTGSVDLYIEAPEIQAEGTQWRPTYYMQKVSSFLDSILPEGAPSIKAVEDGVGGNKETIRKALGVLVDEGYATRTSQGQAVIHRSIRRYFDNETVTIL